MACREASHAGSWYSDNGIPEELAEQCYLRTSQSIMKVQPTLQYSSSVCVSRILLVKLAKIFQGTSVKIIPIMVGACPPDAEATYGRTLAKFIDDPANFFSISSDFCHWGSRFGYQCYEKKRSPIYKSIEALDQSGMDTIESGKPDAFQEYLSEFENSICGRHPIRVFLPARILIFSGSLAYYKAMWSYL